MKIRAELIVIILLSIHYSCINSSNEENANNDELKLKNVKKDTIAFLFDTTLCKGFDFPVGNKNAKGDYTDIQTGKKHTGWYKAVKFYEKYVYGIHPAEDWNGNGGGNTDLGQPVYSIGKGTVINAENAGGNWGNTVVIEYIYYENGAVKKLRSYYMHLDSIFVQKGDFIRRRQQVGTLGNNFGMFPAHLHFELRKEILFKKPLTYWPPGENKEDEAKIRENYEHPTEFIKKHRKIQNPVDDSIIVVALKHKYKLYICKFGKVSKIIPIALGQEPHGHKIKQGDNKTPEGEYYINEKKLGSFGGKWGDFFGTAWIRLSYPNTFDAAIGLKNKLISSAEYYSIKNAIDQKSFPPKNTALGGGIGIHGWAGKWNTEEQNDLTWGCISINNDQLLEFYNLVPNNTRVLILP